MKGFQQDALIYILSSLALFILNLPSVNFERTTFDSATSMANNLEKRVLSFWFEGYPSKESSLQGLIKNWFMNTPSFDDSIRYHFQSDIEAALEDREHLIPLKQTPQGLLTLILLLDQFTRNIYRNTPKMFSGDPGALKLARDCISRGWHKQLSPIQRSFIYLPFEHSEELRDQETSVRLFEELASESSLLLNGEKEAFEGFLGYAKRHEAVIKQFGRFPHRNELLNRPSTPEEVRYLAGGGENFMKTSSK